MSIPYNNYLEITHEAFSSLLRFNSRILLIKINLGARVGLRLGLLYGVCFFVNSALLLNLMRPRVK